MNWSGIMGRSGQKQAPTHERIVRTQSGETCLPVVIVLTVFTIVCFMLVRPIIRSLLREPPDPGDALAAKMKMIVEAYPRWREKSDRPCPAELATVLRFAIPRLGAQQRRFISVTDENDLWKRPLIMVCAQTPRHGLPADQPFGVISTGPDRKLGTPDDIRSWQLE